MKTKLVVTSGFDTTVGDEPRAFTVGERVTDAALIRQLRESHPAHVVASTLTDEEADELKAAEPPPADTTTAARSRS